MPARSPSKDYERAYQPDHPGYALHGYLHHVDGAAWDCSQSIDAANADRPAIELRLKLLGQDFANCRDRFLPYIPQWESELRRRALAVGHLSEVDQEVSRVLPALSVVWASCAEAKVVGEHIDTSESQKALVRAVAAIDRVRALWPQFDASRAQVDAAVEPWLDAQRWASDIYDDICGAIRGTQADSIERIRAVEGIHASIEGELTVAWTGAVRHALTGGLATEMQTACVRVRDAARDALSDGIRARYGMGDWVARIDSLNTAVLQLGDLRPLVRRAVDEARSGSREAQVPPLAATPLGTAEPEWLTVTDTAKLLGMATWEVSRLVESGRLRSNGKQNRARRIYALSAVAFSMDDDKDRTIKKLRRKVK